MDNGTMIQYFHWYVNGEGNFWKEVKEKADWLKEIGISSVWLPPVYKGSKGTNSEGYDVYDIYDLGEFDQKGTTRTKYGTKQELHEAIDKLQQNGLQVFIDIVVNHMAGGDETELIKAYKVDENNRNQTLSAPFDIEAFTRFTFPGRKGQYSEFIWNFLCFTGVDYDHKTGERSIYKIVNEWGEGWEDVIDNEKGNYDYLMFNDVEFRNPALREELKRWGLWLHEQLHFDGLRLDAVKHIAPMFYNEWLDHMREKTGKEIFAVGEYWAPGYLELLLKYLEATEDRMSLFDSSLHNNLHNASKQGKDYDLSAIFKDTLVSARPDKAVTVVDNHDTQPLQSLEAPVEPWFKPLAYALVLLRQEGYPCIFYPDLFGAPYKDHGRDGNEYEIFLEAVPELPTLIQARRDLAWGEQKDYFDHPNCIGWTRTGDEGHEGCAVVMSNGDDGFKHMEMGTRYAGRKFHDILGKHDAVVDVKEDGWADFPCRAGSVSVWKAES